MTSAHLERGSPRCQGEDPLDHRHKKSTLDGIDKSPITQGKSDCFYFYSA